MFDVEDEGVIAIDEIGNVLRAMGQSPTTQTIDAMKEEANAGKYCWSSKTLFRSDACAKVHRVCRQ